MNEHYAVDDDTGKTEGPFTDDEMMQKLHGAASSDPQEWTPQHIKVLWQANRSFDDNLQFVCDSINAALAAERDRLGLELTNKYFDQSEQRDSISELVDMEAFKRGYKQAELDLEKQLAAERELASELVGDLRIELRAERELRKPLVESLERIEALVDAYNDTDTRPAVAVLSDIDAALTKAKEGK